MAKTQVWAAIAVNVLAAIVKKRTDLDLGWHKMLQIPSVTIFEKTPLLRGFSYFDNEAIECNYDIHLKLKLFNLRWNTIGPKFEIRGPRFGMRFEI